MPDGFPGKSRTGRYRGSRNRGTAESSPGDHDIDDARSRYPTALSASSICPACGRQLPVERLGVWMSQKKARMFDLIKRAGPAGIHWHDIHAFAFSERQISRETLKAHIWQINEILDETGWRISGRDGVYKLTSHGRRGATKAI